MRLLAGFAAALVLAGAPVRAALPPVTLVVPEPALPSLAALPPAVSVAVVPNVATLALAEPLAKVLAGGRGLVLRSPIPERLPAVLRGARAPGDACRVLVRGEGGLTFPDVAVLERLGPCAYDVRLGEPPTVLGPRLARLRPATFTWRSEAATWEATALARFAALPGATLSVREPVAGLALAQLERLALGIALEIRLEGRTFPPALAARIAQAKVPAYVQVRDLDPALARALRLLPLAGVRVEPEAITPTLLAGLEALTRLVDPPDARRPSEAEMDGPLFGR